MATVFVSYRRADQAAAERLAAEIRDHGHDVWLDIWKLRIGDSIIGEIDKGLAAASFLVLCLSEDASTSPWMDTEWMSTLARQLNGAAVRLLPARLSGGTAPAILADIKYADLVRDWAGGVDAICRAMG
jgi:TIR domain